MANGAIHRDEEEHVWTCWASELPHLGGAEHWNLELQNELPGGM